MANKEKMKYNQIREQIRKQFSARLKEQDEAIRGLSAENKELREENGRLRNELREAQGKLASMDEWLERMQDYVNLSDDEMEEVRKSLKSSKEGREAMQSLNALLSFAAKSFPFFGG